TVAGFADYRQKLRDARVILRAEDRAKAISLALYELAAKADLTIKDDPALLEEVTGLVEWPVVLMGAIDPAFLDLPPEVLTTSRRASSWSPTWLPMTAAKRLSPATSVCCAPAFPTRASSGSRTARSRSRHA